MPPERSPVTAGDLEPVAPYRKMVEEWRQAVDVNALPDALAASVRSDLEHYDRAVTETLAALEEMPGDTALTDHVIRTLQAQARLLARVSQATETL